MQPPENVTALQCFLSMINYLGKFIPNLSELSAPCMSWPVRTSCDGICMHQIHIKTDHQPLVMINNKPIYMAPARLQGMMIRLEKYNFTITRETHVPCWHTVTFHSACPNKLYDDQADIKVMSVWHISSSRLKELQTRTAQNPVLQHLCSIIKSRWPSSQLKLPVEIHEYFPFRDKLKVDEDILMKGQRVVIPGSLHSENIMIFHRNHPGLEATKHREQGIVFWPSVMKEIEDKVTVWTVFL